MSDVNSTIGDYQDEIWPWAVHNFGDPTECPTHVAVLGLAEEAGEACRAVLKRVQGIRGTDREWTEELAKELGDCFIKVIEIGAREGFDMETVLMTRWNDVKQRDFKADKIGHGMPEA